MEANRQVGAAVLRADGSIEGYVPENGNEFSIEEANRIVGSNIASLPFEIEGKKYVFAIDADGEASGKKFNEDASSLARILGALQGNGRIYGDAVLCPASLLAKLGFRHG